MVAETTPASPAGPATQRILGLNRAGRILWERADSGTLHLSGNGETVLLHHPGPQGGVTVLAGATGKVLWEARAEGGGGGGRGELLTRRIVRAPPGREGRLALHVVQGECCGGARPPVRSEDGRHVGAGKRTAVLLNTGQLVLLNEQGDTTGVVALTAGDAKSVTWDLLSLSDDGARIVALGRAGLSQYLAQAFAISPTTALWTEALKAEGDAGLAACGQQVVVAVLGKTAATFRLAGPERPTPGGTRFASRVTAWGTSPDGRWLAVLSGARVTVLSVAP